MECPLHGSECDIRSCEVMNLPAVTPVPTYEVRVNEENIEVAVAS